jgi:hypothetical protein
LEEEEMFRKTMIGVAVSALAVAAFQTQASAGGGHNSRIFEILDEIGSESEYEQGPSCDWIARQARKVGTAYWRNRYNEECSGGDDDDGDDD